MKKITNKRKNYLDEKSVWTLSILNKDKKRRLLWTRSRRRMFRLKRRQNLKRSELLGHVSNHCGQWMLPTTNISVELTSNFSIIDNPKETVKLIAKLAKQASMRPNTFVGKVNINQYHLLNFDLAASALLDMVVIEMQKEVYDSGMSDVDFRGVLPKNNNAKRFIRAIGLPKHLGIPDQALDLNELAELKIFEERVRIKKVKDSPNMLEKRDEIVFNFVNHINGCLVQSRQVELTTEGRDHLSLCLVELINNAEEHSGMTDWSLYGYLDSAASLPVLEVAMINFGASIAETFFEIDESGYTWSQIREYVKSHSEFNLFEKNWRIQDLLTVVALQPKVSTKNTDLDPTRGAGTVQLMEFFQSVDRYCNGEKAGAKMAILSGSTHIFFDGTYKLADSSFVEGRQSIAFNADNNLFKKPDSKYVQSLGDVFFPGTVISIKFPILQGMTELQNG